MSARTPPPHAADANQARASDPIASAWVSANAGTGKTEVLVKRVLRLLLAGARPECILCLTYTKTAAAEMQNRLLKELADWATTPTDELRKKLGRLLGTAPQDSEVQKARRLFASALEAKGGLKIHTIHGFCERLLQRFPLESQVTPHFSVLDERNAARLRRAAFDATIARAAENKGNALGKALAKIIGVAGEEYFRQVIDAVLAKRAELARMIALHGGASDWAEAEAAALKRLFGLAEDDEAALAEGLCSILTEAEIDAALAALSVHGGKQDDAKTEAGLRAARASRGEGRVGGFRGRLSHGGGEAAREALQQGL